MDDNETKVFDWTNLNVESGSHEFRLLKLLPSTEHHAEIRCQLFHSSLDSHPGYEALSYAWGDANVTLPICLNSLEHHVTVNLEMALRYLRLEDQERILWIDALCINQRYILEKNHQVKNMRTIYLQAGRVVVWLGEEGTAQLAIDFCRRRQQIMESGLNEDIEEPPTEDNDIEEDIKICWDLFMGRKYWARLWVVQEIHHHNPVLVQIGKVSIDFGELYNLYATYQRTSIARLLKIEWQGEPQITLPYGFHSWNFERLVNFQSVLFKVGRYRESIAEEPNRAIRLSSLLLDLQEQQATEPRDRVYALLGIADEPSLVVDYDRTP